MKKNQGIKFQITGITLAINVLALAVVMIIALFFFDSMGNARSREQEQTLNESFDRLIKQQVEAAVSILDNDLRTIDVSKNLELLELYCSRAGLTSVDVSKNEKLMDIGVIGNNLTTIDLSNNPEIIWLELMANKITSLDVSKNEKLTDLQVQDNLLTSLDVSNNPELNFFYCYNNKITSLDVSNNPRLNNLKCWNNRMSELDVTNMRLDMGVFYVHCGNQTTDGTTPQTLTLTMREDMKAFYTKNLANAKDSETGYVYNANVVVAE